MEAVARQISKHDGRGAGGGTEAARHLDTRGAARAQLGSAAESLLPLPQRGERFTEDQMRERFGVPKGGGIRESLTSPDIVLVRNVRSDYDDVEEGGRVLYDGQYYVGKPNQMILGNLELSRSRESGRRVLYFVKEDGILAFDGLVECAASRPKDAPARPGALVFELERIDAAGTAAVRRQGARGSPPGSGAHSAPDLDMIMAVEHQISSHGSLADRSELLAALPMGIDSAGLDRILEYLELSAKISVDGGAVTWTFGGGPCGHPSAGGGNVEEPFAADAAEESARVLSMAERLSPDLDNDRPYRPEIERRIADCKAGRPIGKTYTAEEYLEHLEREHGIGSLERPV